MKLVLLGRGRMGAEVERLARQAGHEIVVQLDIDSNRDSGLENGNSPEGVGGGDPHYQNQGEGNEEPVPKEEIPDVPQVDLVLMAGIQCRKILNHEWIRVTWR